jgi:hypothetical protein
MDLKVPNKETSGFNLENVPLGEGERERERERLCTPDASDQLPASLDKGTLSLGQ